ncbi:hypothetical protein CDD82_7129 [Ophiocordyceps australis]|uniref:Postreplication repair E3 ubiquitin-protein ligase RAD18 n=1 Tax=Ophiocordyceps australis TaxID=1399860 RepID=A0A2C5YZN7_9HYPO|nr:hypothetical protein CDD82_7129 [Ophiocordyceps australis]
MSGQEIPDSTDWLATPLSGLAAVESALRCQVCKDFYKTPMMTSCSHTFCSLCIRRALSSDGRCPLCRAMEQELKLRSNLSLEEAVEAFIHARSVILPIASEALAPPPSPRKRKEAQQEAQSPPKRLRTSARLSKNRTAHTPQDQSGAPSPQSTDETSEPQDLVPCPSCQREMKAWQVFDHLQACPGPSDTSNAPLPLITQLAPRPDKSHERLPALNYSMLKEQALRKKLAELGISSQGPRFLLEKRHREWMTLWNSNCDAARPKRRLELLRDLDVWERTQGGKAPTTGKDVQTAAAIKDKSFDGAAWAAKHDSSFKHLIISARRAKAEAQSVVDTDHGNGRQGQEADDDGVAAPSPTITEPAKCSSPAIPQDSLETHELASSHLPIDSASDALQMASRGSREECNL